MVFADGLHDLAGKAQQLYGGLLDVTSECSQDVDRYVGRSPLNTPNVFSVDVCQFAELDLGEAEGPPSRAQVACQRLAQIGGNRRR